MHNLLLFPIPCKIQNSYLSFADGKLDQFTVGIAIKSMLDLEHNTNFICIHLETRISININSGFVHFLSHSNEEDQTMNIIDSQEHEPYGRASSCEEQESS